MSSALRQTMSAEEFLTWEERQPQRYEFDGAHTVAMTGARETHADIQANLITSLRNRLRGKPCRGYGPELKILASGSYRYPDALIVCGPREGRRTVVTEPVVVFEIISESTESTDRIVKNIEYRNTSSIQRYIILEQAEVGATVFSRLDGDWIGRVHGPGSVLTIPEAEIELPLAELYDGLDFTA